MAKSYLDKVNEHWNQQFGTNFTDVLTKVPEANLTQKLTASEKKKKARNTHRRVKKSLEGNFSQVDTETVFGIRQSRSQYEKQRMAQCFESKENAQNKFSKSNNGFIKSYFDTSRFTAILFIYHSEKIMAQIFYNIYYFLE